MAIVTVGIDLAKNVFAVHGVDESGRPTLVRPEVACAKLMELIAKVVVAIAAKNARIRLQALPKAKLSVSFLRLWGSPYVRLAAL